MKKVVRLTEADLVRLVKKTIQESKRKNINELEYAYNPEALETGPAIVTMVVTVLSLLGVAGSHYIKAMIDRLRKEGREDEALEVESALEQAQGKEMEGMDDEDFEY